MVRRFTPLLLAALALSVANPLSAAPPLAPLPREATQKPKVTAPAVIGLPFSQTYAPGSKPLLPSDIGPYPQYFPAPGVPTVGSTPAAPASVPAAKTPARPVGVWVRDVGPVKVVLKVTDDRLTATAIFATGEEACPVVRVTLDADYAVAKDGTLFGVVFGADATHPMYTAVFQPLTGQPFAFGWRVDDDTLTVRNLKWLGSGLHTAKATEFDELPVLGNGRYTRIEEGKLQEWEKKLTGTTTPLMRTVVGGGLTAPPTRPAPSAPPLFRHVEGKCEAPTPVTPVPASAAPAERPGCKVESRGPVPVLPPQRKGAMPDAPPPPCIHEVLKALPPAPRGVPLVFDVSRENLEQTAWVVKELESEKLDPPRFFPLVGIACLHHATWKCTVTFSETITSDFPFPVKTTHERIEVVRVPQMSLHQYTVPEVPAAPSVEPTKVSNGAGNVIPASGTAPTNLLHGTWVRERDGMQVVLKFTEKRLNVEINAALTMPGENGPPIRFTQSLDADYSNTPDGTVFGILTGMDVTFGEGFPPEVYASLKEARRQYEKKTGAMFKFRTRLDGGRVTLSEARACVFDSVRGPTGEGKADTTLPVDDFFGGRFERVTGAVPPPKPTAGGIINQYSEDPNVRIEPLQKPADELRQKGTGPVPPSSPAPKCKDCAPSLKPIPGGSEPVPQLPMSRG